MQFKTFSQKPLHISKKQAILLVFVLFIASLGLHIYTTWNSAFLGDAVLHYNDIVTFLEEGKPFVLGPSMTGTPCRVPGGFYYQLLLIPYFLTGSIMGMKFFGMLLGMLFAAIFIVYVCKRFQPLTALFFALLLLFNFYFFKFSSDFWNANFTVPFILLAFLILIDLANQKINPKNGMLIAPLIALAVQTHFSTFFVLPGTVILFALLYRKKMPWKYLLIGVGLAALLYVPYLLYEIERDFINTEYMLQRGSKAAFAIPRVYVHFLFPTNEISYYLGRGSEVLNFYFQGNPLGIIQFVFALLTLLVNIAANIFCLFFIPKIRQRTSWLSGFSLNPVLKTGLVLMLSAIVSLLVTFTVFKISGSHWHYMFALFPLSFLPLLVLFDFVRQKMPRLAIGLFIFQAINIGVLVSLIVHYNQQKEAPLNYQAQTGIVRTILSDSNGKPFHLLTSYSRHNDDHYEKLYGAPRFYEGIAELLMQSNWNEVEIGEATNVYLLDAEYYPPLPEELIQTNTLQTLWTNRGAVLYRIITSGPANSESSRLSQ